MCGNTKRYVFNYPLSKHRSIPPDGGISVYPILMRNTKTKKPSLLIQTDEEGRPVYFRVPFAAMYYDHSCVSLAAQDRIDDTKDELIDAIDLNREN